MYVVGQVLKPQGIKGEIKVKSISPESDRFKNLKKIYIQKENLESYSIASVRISNKFVFLKLLGISNREEAESLRGYDILIDKSDLIELLPDEYFVHDLIDCTVFSEEGFELGKIVEISQLRSNDIYIVKNKIGNEILIPAVKNVIKQVDLEKKIITVHLLEGMID
jgi:16S rRNA processing protein RimM